MESQRGAAPVKGQRWEHRSREESSDAQVMPSRIANATPPHFARQLLYLLTDDETFFGEMTAEGESAGNGMAAHAIEAGDINKAQLPPAGRSPLGESTLEAVFADDDDFGHGQHLVVKVFQRRGSQTPLD